MGRSAKRTTDHEKIRKWAEARDGHPATVKGTGKKGDPGLLRIDFPGYSGVHTLQRITWDDFFEKFDEQQLDFLYQEKTDSGKPSRFCKLVNREANKGGGGKKREAAKADKR
jgi:hypothetical protein